MPKAKIELPSVFTEDHWVYKKHKDNRKLDHLLGQPYISYSTSESFTDYTEDFIKQKFAGIKLPESVYGAFGTWVGSSVEHGSIQDNDYGFEGSENILKIKRPENAEYERLVIIEFEGYFFMGFIDIFVETEEKVCCLFDIKTGGKNKEKKYTHDDYTQVILYGHALEQEGWAIDKTGVVFCRREGSHLNPPLRLSDEQLYLPLEYNQKRVKHALKRLDNSVKGISELFKTYKKVFR